MNLASALSFIAAALMLALSLLHMRRSGKGPQEIFFILSFLMFTAVETALGIMLCAADPVKVLGYFRMLLACLIFFPALGLPFFLVFGRRDDRTIISKNLPAIITLGVLLLVAALTISTRSIVEKIHFTENGPFWGMSFTGYGKGIGVYLLLVNVFILYLFENTYRSASIPGKVTLKYPLLGLLTVSIMNFVVISRVLTLSVLDINFIAVQTCGIIILCISFAYATLRYSLFEVRAYIGREVAASVISIVVAGLYLLALALIIYIAKLMGVSYDLLTITVLGIFALFLLIAVLLSGKARRRVRRFIDKNFYPNAYDYRKEWSNYSRLMASSRSIDDFISNFISVLCETMLVTKGLVRIEARGGMTAFYGFQEESLEEHLLKKIAALFPQGPIIIAKKYPFELSPRANKSKGRSPPALEPGWVKAVAFIGQGEECRGFIALGPKHMGTSYTEEDRQFLTTVSNHANLTIENLVMEERVLESNQMESFNRFASFVIHDLKNTVGMLSLTAENARENINDADFQKDAIETIKRSVEKMQKLIDSLNVHRSPASLSREPVDIKALIDKSIKSIKHVAASKEITLVYEGGKDISSEADPAAIKRVVENLILNAIEATPEGGKIEVEAQEREKNRITIKVKDSGAGFDPVYLRNDLFRPFRTTKKDGLGIGLLLCKSLVEAHGGEIAIESERGRGSTVSIDLPKKSNELYA